MPKGALVALERLRPHLRRDLARVARECPEPRRALRLCWVPRRRHPAWGHEGPPPPSPLAAICAASAAAAAFPAFAAASHAVHAAAAGTVAIGGGVFGVLILTSFGRSVHRAVATAAGFGLAIAVPGAIGFVLAGQGAPVPPGAFGYVHLVGFASLAVATAVTAPLGARLAHSLSAALLTRLFAIYLLITGLLLIRDVVAG